MWARDVQVVPLLARGRTRVKIDVKSTFPAYH
jgi:hypothetical protein